MVSVRNMVYRSVNCRRRLAGESGLSLIEILVAMMIFLVVAAGVAGTLMAGIRGTAHARLATMGKAAAQEQIEEMRGRVFFVPYDDDPTVGTTADIDLLDLYYPGLNTSPTTDSGGWTGWYTSSGGDAYFTRVSPAGDRGIVRTVETRFVDDSLEVIVPPDAYDANSQDADTPPSNLVQVTVTTTWADRGEEKSYTLDSLISGTGQQPPEESSGCLHASNSRATITGGTMVASTGTSDPYTTLVSSTLGSAYVNGSFGCSSSVHATATGGEQVISGGATYTGATASVTGPPDGSESDGPVTAGPPNTWPKPYIGSSTAAAEVTSEGADNELKAEGEAKAASQTLQLQQVDGVPSGGGSCSPSNCRRWDFINPVLTVTGGSEEQAEAELEQVDGVTTITGEVHYQQVNILPLNKATNNPPAAAQGLVFIRNFTATSTSEADPASGSASNSLTYSATVGMFNTSKAAGCSGDACYDLYTISPSNPLQTAINLNDSNYKLQKELVTEWQSSSTADINNAMFASADGTSATIDVDALLKISLKYGTGLQLKRNSVTWWTSQQGLMQVWLGSFNVSVAQYE